MPIGRSSASEPPQRRSARAPQIDGADLGEPTLADAILDRIVHLARSSAISDWSRIRRRRASAGGDRWTGEFLRLEIISTWI
jgi:hypothetical protein